MVSLDVWPVPVLYFLDGLGNTLVRVDNERNAQVF